MMRNPPGRVEKADFRLTLGRTVWHLVGTKGTEEWLAKFARILELDPWSPTQAKSRPARKLFFLNSQDSSPDSTQNFLSLAAAAGLGQEGWTGQWTNPTMMWTHPDSQDIVLELRFLDHDGLAVENMSKSCHALFLPILTDGGLILHAALIERNGRGIALVASGGVGKSTCARRIPAPWKALCDDTCLVLPNGRGSFQAHPFATWSDYLWKRSQGTWKVESHVPLQAVFFLKHAQEDNAQPLGQGESSIYLSRSSHEILSGFLQSMDHNRARLLRQRIFANACALRQTVPAYWLEVGLDGPFWTEIEKALG
jgi:SynChlorMet cassette protein ScmC